jgi:predicted amidohydrolase
MPVWTIAAAQYEPRNRSVAENITHHLRFIDAAAAASCEVLFFPELSLTGPERNASLPLPPDAVELHPLSEAATRHKIIVIAGLPVYKNGKPVKGLAIFVPGKQEPVTCAQGKGACLAPLQTNISVLPLDADAAELDPKASLLATGYCPDEPHEQLSTATLQRFAHKYAIAVLKSDYASGTLLGGSALWDEQGQLIVRADRGELLLTGQKHAEGWQGDIIPLR